MFKLGDIGKFETLPEVAQYIYEGNLAALETKLLEGWDIQQQIVLSKYTSLSPLDLALLCGQLAVIKLLVEHGVELNEKDNPAFLLAVRYCGEEIIRYVHQHGAKLNRLNHVKSGAYDQAYYGNKKNIPLIQELGLDIREHAGRTLRKAVSDHDRKTVDYLLEQGVNINYNEPDMVYPYKATPLTVAVRSNNFTMVKYLVEQGADVTIAEKDGERAYTIAVSNDNAEMAAYIKSLEPPEFHTLSNKLHALKDYKLSQQIVDFLTGTERRIVIADNDYEVSYIEFFALVDTIEMKVGRQKLLRLSSRFDNYSHILLVWHPGKKCLGYYDLEHKEYAHLGSFTDFLADPKSSVDRIFNS
ncbi:ankyrin repeat domain-containing protein [Paenibacillaceae bacterium]|nr:ankyrin repeat domain-containing protein [Paenibacillaceae bacterium]